MRKLIKYIIIIIAIIVIIVLGINFYVKKSTKNQILTEDDYSKLSDVYSSQSLLI